MAGDIFLSLFIAVPIVLLTAAFVFHIEMRREDTDDMARRDHEVRENRMGPGAPTPPSQRVDKLHSR